MRIYKDQHILVTGGTGTLGQAIVKKILSQNPASVVIYSRGEFRQWQMAQDFGDIPELHFIIGDICNRDDLNRALKGIDIVIHTAAVKHVPVAENNPVSAAGINIFGTMNVVHTAIDNGVKKAILISTDKAVHPANYYGATKLVAERLFIQANTYRETMFSVVRYGNVMSSRGSVIPLWRKQAQSGQILVTHSDMNRFFITLPQAIDFITESVELMSGGEIFVPRLPSIRIMDLAEAVAPGVEVKLTGMRPGEKLNEVLVSREEAPHTARYTDHFVIEPEFPWWDYNLREDKPLLGPYSSDNNTWWLDVDGIKGLMDEQNS